MSRLDQFEKIVERGTQGLVTQQEFQEVIEMLAKLIKTVESLQTAFLDENYAHVLKELDSTKKFLEESAEEIKEENHSELTTFKTDLSRELRNLRVLVDGLPTPEEIRDKVMEILPPPPAPLPPVVTPLIGDELINAINADETDGKIKKERIEGWDEMLKKANNTRSVINGGIAGRDLFKDIDISDQLDGVTKTFNIQAVWNIIAVDLSSFPHALRKNVDFTYTPTSITFTSQIDAATSLAAGQTCVLTAVTG